jgi:hypothetical protein
MGMPSLSREGVPAGEPGKDSFTGFLERLFRTLCHVDPDGEIPFAANTQDSDDRPDPHHRR